MTWHVDANHWKIETSGNFQIYQGKCNGNASASVNHLIEEAITRIVVLARVTCVTEVIIEILVKALEHPQRISLDGQALLYLSCHYIKSVEVSSDVKVRVFFLSNVKRCYR